MHCSLLSTAGESKLLSANGESFRAYRYSEQMNAAYLCQILHYSPLNKNKAVYNNMQSCFCLQVYCKYTFCDRRDLCTLL